MMWSSTLALIFGGCCTNAITLEQLTSQYPSAGSLITFLQFIIISLYGLPIHLAWTPYGPRFKHRTIPLTPYLIQVFLFYFISLLNNAAFAYRIPMAVHIIFRSGGLIITLLLGWLIVGKRYSPTQVLSVLLVTLGVALTTLSASGDDINTTTTTANPYTYATGIAILTLALLLSGFLGLVQDWTYSKYGRPGASSSNKSSHNLKQVEKNLISSSDDAPAWQESMFYLHLLALPMFMSIRKDLAIQFTTINAGPRFSFHIPLSHALHSHSPIFRFIPIRLIDSSFVSMSPSHMVVIHIPKLYLPLLMNTLTQLLCVAGVHRLTTRVSALTVTLVLVVRKAMSLVLSVIGLGVQPQGQDDRRGAGWERTQKVNVRMMWAGALMVLLGSVGYSVATTSSKEREKKHIRDKTE